LRILPRIPQIAVLVDTSRSYGRDIVRGIRRYVAEYGPWSLYLEPRDLHSRFPDWLKNWPGDGILSRTVDDAMLRQLKATKLPVIELRTTVLPHSFPFVGMDNHIVGTRVAEHLRNRGFRRFACYFDTAEAFFVERSERFAQALREHGFECSCFNPAGRGAPALGSAPACLVRVARLFGEAGGRLCRERSARLLAARCRAACGHRRAGGSRRRRRGE
jgi:DNA-binding LacI/PurR family transcriptional regulator